MKVKVLGMEVVDYVNKSNKRVLGRTLYVVDEEKQTTQTFAGQKTGEIFTTLDCSKVQLGSVLDLVYELPLGSKYPKLSKIIPC